MNTYIYVGGNPLAWIDRKGLEVDDWGGWGFPSPNEHYNRNQNNYCPRREPEGCGWWDQDEGGLLSNKWRAPTGWECAYDANGDLLPDTAADGEQNYSYNYGAGTNPWNPRHIWQDVVPHYWYDDNDGEYSDGLTNSGSTAPFFW